MNNIKNIMEILDRPKRQKPLLTIDMLNKENANPNSSKCNGRLSCRNNKPIDKRSQPKIVADLTFFNISHRSNRELTYNTKMDKMPPQACYMSKEVSKSNRTHLMLKNIIRRDTNGSINQKVQDSYGPDNHKSIDKQKSFRFDIDKKENNLLLNKLGSALKKRKAKQFNLNTVRKTVLKVKENPQNCLAYLPNIMKHLLDKERKQQQPEADFFSRQPEINDKMRYLLFDWLVSVSLDLKLHEKTLILATDLVELYTSSFIVPRVSYQLIGISALFMASKYEEIYPPTLKDFVVACNNFYSSDKIIEVETKLLNLISFDMTRVTSLDFFHIFSQSMDLPKKAHNLGLYLLNLSIMDLSLMSTNRAVLALATCYLGAKLLKLSWKWKVGESLGKKVIQFSVINASSGAVPLDSKFAGCQVYSFSETEVKNTVVKLYRLLKTFNCGKESAIFKKFSKDEFLKVALLEFD